MPLRTCVSAHHVCVGVGAAAVGWQCEKKADHVMACEVYRRSGGQCDEDFLRASTAGRLFKDQALYLVKSHDEDLWRQALSSNNRHRPSLLEQVQSVLSQEEEAPSVSSWLRQE